MTAMAVVSETTLRCHSCSHAIGTSAIPMEFVGTFHPRWIGQLEKMYSTERRHRCVSCGWLNVFHPLQQSKVSS